MTNYRNTSSRSYFDRPGRGRSTNVVGGVLLALVAVVLAVLILPSYFHQVTNTATVFDKARVCDSSSNGSQDCKYLIYTSHGTYRLQDSIAIGRFTSSDAYGRIRTCHKYDITSYGFRFGPTSSYPNIVKVVDRGVDKTCSN